MVTNNANKSTSIKDTETRNLLYAADSSCLTSNTEFSVNTIISTSTRLYSKTIWLETSSRYVVFYEEYNQGYNIYGSILDSCGNLLINKFGIADYTMGDQTRVSGSFLKNGNFIVVWDSNGQTQGYQWNIYLAIFDQNGIKIVADTQVNTLSYGGVNPQVTTLLNSNFVVSWHACTSDCDVYTRGYDQNGVPIQNQDLLVNTVTTWNQWFCQINSLKNGGFIVAYLGGQNFGYYQVYLQIFDKNFNKIGSELLVSSDHTQQQEFENVVSAITDLGNNRAIIVFNYAANSFNLDDSSTNTYAKGALINYDASTVITFFSIQSNSVYHSGGVNVAALANNRFIVTWHMENYVDGNSWDPYIQYYELDVEDTVIYLNQDSTQAPSLSPLRLDSNYIGEQSRTSLSSADNNFLVTWFTDQSGTIQAKIITIPSNPTSYPTQSTTAKLTVTPTTAPAFKPTASPDYSTKIANNNGCLGQTTYGGCVGSALGLAFAAIGTFAGLVGVIVAIHQGKSSINRVNSYTNVQMQSNPAFSSELTIFYKQHLEECQGLTKFYEYNEFSVLGNLAQHTCSQDIDVSILYQDLLNSGRLISFILNSASELLLLEDFKNAIIIFKDKTPSAYNGEENFITIRSDIDADYINSKSILAHELTHMVFDYVTKNITNDTLINVCESIEHLLAAHAAELLKIKNNETIPTLITIFSNTALSLFYLKSTIENTVEHKYDIELINNLAEVLSTDIKNEEELVDTFIPQIIEKYNLNAEQVYFLERVADYINGVEYNLYTKDDHCEEIAARCIEFRASGVSDEILNLCKPIEDLLIQGINNSNIDNDFV